MIAVYQTLDLKDFPFTGEAANTVKWLIDEDFNELELCLIECGEMWSMDAINDLFGYDKDSIAMWLDYKDWADLMEHRE